MKLLNARKKLVTLAVASAIAGSMTLSAPAQAMNVSQNNVGQVLLFPYYTVKNGFDTLFSVTNTTDKTAVFKVRFREALNSREVRDFDVVLSPHDVWTGVVTQSSTTAGDGAIRTFDNSCTSPDKPSWTAINGGYEVPFSSARYTGTYSDGASTSITRTEEGYIEVILMGVSSDDTATSTNVVAYNAKHTGSTPDADAPRDCAKVDAAFLNIGANFNAGGANTATGYELGDGTSGYNILKGHETLIDVTNGTAIDAEPTAIENFYTSATGNLVYQASDVNPGLDSGAPGATANMLINGTAVAEAPTSALMGSQDAITELLMAQDVINEYATGGTGTVASTSWVVTMPTKHYYVDGIDATNTTIKDGTPLAPFHNWFHTTANDGESCDSVSFNYWDRNELAPTTPPSQTNFSPYDASSPTGVSLCYEANVISYNVPTGSTGLFGGVNDSNITQNRTFVDTTAVGTSGVVDLGLPTDLTFGTNSMTGLPVIGFAAIVRDTGSSSTNYGSSEQHTYVK